MEAELILNRFARIGARARFVPLARRSFGWNPIRNSVAVDIQTDALGEFFSLAVSSDDSVDLEVVDVKPRAKHLLLMIDENERERQKLLCGFDERHWFVAGIPERARAATVDAAMEALQPREVKAALLRHKVKRRQRHRRKNRAFLRQGEWFFLPEPDLRVDPREILRNEPLQRGGGKPHRCEMLVRTGGERVYVSRLHPNGLVESRYRDWLFRHPESKLHWTCMVRNPDVFVKGRVSHPDHKSLRLREWHRVRMNTENESRAMRNVAFLD